MNRLELRYVRMPGDASSPRAHGTEPIVDGESLLDRFGRDTYAPALGVEFPARTGRVEILSGVEWDSSGRSSSPLVVDVGQSDSSVTWSGFDGGPYVFDRRAYDAELARYGAELERRVPAWVRVTAAAWQAFADVLPSGRRLLIGIAGAPGSGKSTLTAEVLANWGSNEPAAGLPMDGFHLSSATLDRLGRRDRMGAPDTFDVDGFVATLEKARDLGTSLLLPGFDRTIEEPIPYAITLPADARFVFVEGNYLLHDRDGWERVRPLLDRVFFLAPDDAARRERLIARHIAYGKSPAEAEEWVARSDDPNAALVAATAHRADRIFTSLG